MPSKQAYDLRKSQGLCPKCGTKRHTTYVLCNACRHRSRTSANARRAHCRKTGSCYVCGDLNDRSNRTTCSECSRVESLYNKEYNKRQKKKTTG